MLVARGHPASNRSTCMLIWWHTLRGSGIAVAPFRWDAGGRALASDGSYRHGVPSLAVGDPNQASASDILRCACVARVRARCRAACLVRGFDWVCGSARRRKATAAACTLVPILVQLYMVGRVSLRSPTFGVWTPEPNRCSTISM
jgi:hypothetical protein